MIFGVDYSLSCPCICKLADDATFANSSFKFLSGRKRDISAPKSNIQVELHKEYKTEEERYDHISNTIIQFIQNNSLEYQQDEKWKKFDLEGIWIPSSNVIVYIEGYAMGSKGRVFNIAECTGLFKFKVHQMGWELITVPPTVIKKFATGKGNADKNMMYKAFLERNKNVDLVKSYFDRECSKIGSPVSDIVDSYYIALYSLYK